MKTCIIRWVQVIESLVGMAGPGSVHEHTMLLVFGDHGQTLTGDHGGGAPEEVDTAIFALHMGAYFEFRYAFMSHLSWYVVHVSMHVSLARCLSRPANAL